MGLRVDFLRVRTKPIYYAAHEPDKALVYLRKVQELDPNFAEAHLVLGKVYEEKKDWPKAIAEFELAEKLFSGSPNIVALKAHALALSGNRDVAMRIVSELERMSTRRYVSGVDIALIYCALNDRDRAMTFLENAYSNRGKGLDIIGSDPLFDGCRSDPRFQRLLRRLRLVG